MDLLFQENLNNSFKAILSGEIFEMSFTNPVSLRTSANNISPAFPFQSGLGFDIENCNGNSELSSKYLLMAETKCMLSVVLEVKLLVSLFLNLFNFTVVVPELFSSQLIITIINGRTNDAKTKNLNKLW